MSESGPSVDPAEAERLIAAAFPEAYDELCAYAGILASKGLEWGLLGPREGSRIWSRHIANSLALVDVVGQGLDLADVGSGAGLPGIPLALARPDLRITLLEPLLRRATFLNETIADLGLSERVRVERLRAEDCDETFDVVTARAVAPLLKLVKWTTPLFLPDGELVALKGSSAEDEIADASSYLRHAGMVATIAELSAVNGLEGTRAIRVRMAA